MAAFRTLFATLFVVLAAPLAHAASPCPTGSDGNGWCVTDPTTQDYINKFAKRFNIPKPSITAPAIVNGKSWDGTTTGTTALKPESLTSMPASAAAKGWSTGLGYNITDVTSLCSSSSISGNQGSICKEIVKTRYTYYQYMKTMYDRNTERYGILQQLITERNNILNNTGASPCPAINMNNDECSYARLQGNTNEIATLQALISLDRQQTETVEHGYRMQIDALVAQLSQTAKDAASGTVSSTGGGLGGLVGSVITSAVGAGVLELALGKPKSAPSIFDKQ